jgi:hypothetical protein
MEIMFLNATRPLHVTKALEAEAVSHYLFIY